MLSLCIQSKQNAVFWKIDGDSFPDKGNLQGIKYWFGLRIALVGVRYMVNALQAYNFPFYSILLFSNRTLTCAHPNIRANYIFVDSVYTILEILL